MNAILKALVILFTCALLMPGPATGAEDPPPFKPEEIEQLVAPIALYPDSLVAQILMASTYPLEVVQAARWQKQNASLKGQALEDALEKQPWDPAVKSLVTLPQVIQGIANVVGLSAVRLAPGACKTRQQSLHAVDGVTSRLALHVSHHPHSPLHRAGFHRHRRLMSPRDPSTPEKRKSHRASSAILRRATFWKCRILVSPDE